jgi:hypothetical protein
MGSLWSYGDVAGQALTAFVGGSGFGATRILDSVCYIKITAIKDQLDMIQNTDTNARRNNR